MDPAGALTQVSAPMSVALRESTSFRGAKGDYVKANGANNWRYERLMRRLLLLGSPLAALLIVAALPILSDRLDVFAVHTEVTGDGTVIHTPRLVSVTELQAQRAGTRSAGICRQSGARLRADGPVDGRGAHVLDPQPGRGAAPTDAGSHDLQVHTRETAARRRAAGREDQRRSALEFRARHELFPQRDDLHK